CPAAAGFQPADFLRSGVGRGYARLTIGRPSREENHCSRCVAKVTSTVDNGIETRRAPTWGQSPAALASPPATKEVTAMSLRAGACAVLACLAIFAVSYRSLNGGGAGPDASAPPGQRPGESRAGRPPSEPTPVALNRGPEVLDGFRGDVHPLLTGQTRLE